MKSSIIYSFIIPHHNTPELLQRLCDSIPHREDIEIIIVDDNSDEGKKANIERTDVKSIFLDKEHSKGAGHARNVGIDYATGKWLLFADSDDFYKPGFISILDEYKDDDIEMLFYNVDCVDGDTLLPAKLNRAKIYQKMIDSYDGSQEKSDCMRFLAFGPWRKMLSSEYVKKYGFQFEEIPKDNDHLFALLTSYFSKKWKVDRRCVYTVTYTRGSITFGKMTKEKLLSHFNVLTRRARLNKFLGHPEWNRKCVRGRYPQSSLVFCAKLLRKKRSRTTGLKAIYYYLSNYCSIQRGADYYIDVIKSIKARVEI